MANIVPFEGAQLPDYIRKADPSLNDDLTAHAGLGFPVMSIKGKVFAIVRDGERKIVPNPKDPDSPATFIDVVLVKANKNASKTFYMKGYDDKTGEAAKPDCFSRDGVAPDSQSSSPQSKTCVTCKHNVWGSKVGDNGNKGKACQDNVRLAIAQPTALTEPLMLRVPPASIRNLGEYGKLLKGRGVQYQMVLTRIGFVPEEATPKLTFKPIGFLPENVYNKVQEIAKGDVVQAILGAVDMPSEPAEPLEKVQQEAAADEPKRTSSSTSKVVTEAEVKAAVAKAEAKAPAPAAASDIEIDLDSLSFDD
jgi:hypothetical protein